jgi:HprK-related kinase A
VRHAHNLQVGPAAFRVGSDWPAPIAALGGLYRGYPAPDFCDFTVRLEAERPFRRLIRPSVAIRGDFTLPDAVPMALAHGLLAAEMGMNLQMALGHRRHLLLHAATVEREGRALILTGLSGSGTSTLAAWLGERGWRLMGDEFALLDLAEGELHPFPRAVSLKNEAITVMERLVPAGRFGPVLERTPKGRIRHLRPRDDAIARMAEPARPALILFPRFGRDIEPVARPVGAAEIFVRLTQASTNYTQLGEAGFRALSSLVTNVPAVALDYPSGEAAEAQIEALWAHAAEAVPC